jgi:hypothetical protein
MKDILYHERWSQQEEGAFPDGESSVEKDETLPHMGNHLYHPHQWFLGGEFSKNWGRGRGWRGGRDCVNPPFFGCFRHGAY